MPENDLCKKCYDKQYWSKTKTTKNLKDNKSKQYIYNDKRG